MPNATPEPSAEAARAALVDLEARWSRTDDELAVAVDALGQAVAAAGGEHTQEVADAQRRVASLQAEVETIEAGYPVVRAQVEAAQVRQAEHARAGRDEAATEADALHRQAAEAFDAAAVVLAATYAEYTAARQAVESARKVAGWPPLPGRPGHTVASALAHAAPDLVRGLRQPLGNALFLRRGITRPLADYTSEVTRND